MKKIEFDINGKHYEVSGVGDTIETDLQAHAIGQEIVFFKVVGRTKVCMSAKVIEINGNTTVLQVMNISPHDILIFQNDYTGDAEIPVDLHKFTKKQLIELAEERGVKLNPSMLKKDMIEKLS